MKGIMALVVVLVFVGLAGIASAETTVTIDISRCAGIAPDSPLYFIDNFIDNIVVRVTNNAETLVNIMNEKTCEYALMQMKNQSDKAAVAMEMYNKVELKVNNMIANMGEEQKLKVMEKLMIHKKVLETVYEIVPEEAKDAINLAITKSTNNIQAVSQGVSEEVKKQIEEKVNTEITTQVGTQLGVGIGGKK